VRGTLKFERNLAKQIEQLMHQLQETRRELRLSPENIQKVIEVALQLASQAALIPTKVPGLWPDPRRRTCPVFHLPVLTGGWEQYAEGLVHRPKSPRLRSPAGPAGSATGAMPAGRRFVVAVWQWCFGRSRPVSAAGSWRRFCTASG
jgi:hypothetical protein